MRWKFLGIFLVALSVRIVFLFTWMSLSHNNWKSGSFGAAELGSIAVNLFEGRGFSSPFSMGSQPSAWECPAVPFLWAAVMHLMGGATKEVERVLFLIQAIPSAFSVSLYWLIARQLRSRMHSLPARFPMILAAVLCFWPESVLRLNDLWYSVWQEIGLAALILVGMKWYERQDMRTAIGLGIIGGMLSLVNITPVPVIIFVLITPAFRLCDKKAFIRRAALSAGVMFLIISPWLIRCRIEFGQFVFLRSNAGFQLLEGNNPIECIRETSESIHPLNQPEQLALVESLGETEYSHQSFLKAVRYIQTHPKQTMIRTLDRVYVAWLTDIFDQWPWGANQQRRHAGRYETLVSGVTVASALALLAVAIFGLMCGSLRKLPYLPLFLAIFFFMPLPHYFTQVDNSYTEIIRTWLLIVDVFILASVRKMPMPIFVATE
jgi:hypothetical protein